MNFRHESSVDKNLLFFSFLYIYNRISLNDGNFPQGVLISYWLDNYLLIICSLINLEFLLLHFENFNKSIIFSWVEILCIFSCTSNNKITPPYKYNGFYLAILYFRVCLFLLLSISLIKIFLPYSNNPSLSISPSWSTFALTFFFPTWSNCASH